MALLPTSYDYTDRDFDALRERLIDLATSVFPDWTDFEIANFGNIMMEMFCFVGDVVTFYEDKQAPEGRWLFVQLRKNAIALAKLIGYELSGATAATADTVISLVNGPLPGDVNIPIFSEIRTEEVTDPIRGQIQEAATIPAGNLSSSDVTWEHSIKRQSIFSSNGLADQEFFLPFSPYLDGSLEISTTSFPTGWEEVDNFLESGPNDLHFTVEVDQNDHATVTFGDNVNGKIPPNGDTVTGDHKTGGGTEGNVEAGTLKRIIGTFQDTLGNPAYLVASNEFRASGGEPRETVAAARLQAPASLRVLNRTVAREDFEINALRVGGVGRALMLSSNEDTGIEENRGRLYIIPSSGSVPSSALKSAVLTMVTDTYPKTITFQVEVLDPAYLDIDVTASIWIREGYTAAQVKADIQTALVYYFEPIITDGSPLIGREVVVNGATLKLAAGMPNPNVDFGYNYKDEDGNPAGEIAWSDIFNEVRDIAGVRKIGAGPDDFLLNNVSDDVPIAVHQFPQLGDVVIKDGETGNQI